MGFTVKEITVRDLLSKSDLILRDIDILKKIRHLTVAMSEIWTVRLRFRPALMR
jgi:DNA repair photolyase